MNNTINTKVFGFLISAAVLSMVFYMVALFRVAPAHAADSIVFSNVAIEDGSMRPLALAVTGSTNVDANVGTAVSPSNSAAVKATVNSSASVNATTKPSESPTASSNISTDSDLNLYTTSLQEQDKNVAKVETKDDYILVGYREPGKFLGFIPVSVTANAKVDADGKVTISYPWYTFLTAKNDADLRTSLDAKNFGTLASLSAQQRAEVIQSLHAALKSRTDASVTSSSDVNGQVTTDASSTVNSKASY